LFIIFSGPNLNDKKTPQIPSPPTETIATKDKKASLVQGMLPPSSSPYDTIHEDLALYKTKPRSDPTKPVLYGNEESE
jgi:hypothetical protein